MRDEAMACSVQKMEKNHLVYSPSMAEKLFLKETIKALVAERLNLPPSNVTWTISIGVAGTAWAPALENIPALTEEGWTWPASSVWFGLVSVAQFWGQNFQSEVPGIRHQTLGTPAWPQGLSCSAPWLLEGWGGDRFPQAQGKVIALFTC